jgi:hypothetical protein
LHHACLENNLTAVCLLLRNGANDTIENFSGFSAYGLVINKISPKKSVPHFKVVTWTGAAPKLIGCFEAVDSYQTWNETLMCWNDRQELPANFKGACEYVPEKIKHYVSETGAIVRFSKLMTETQYVFPKYE